MAYLKGREREKITHDGIVYLHSTAVAGLLGYSVQHVRALCDSRELLGRHIGGAWYVPEAALTPFMRQKLAKEALRREAMRKESLFIKASVAEKAHHAHRIVGREIRQR
jgi:hypothetical protein